MLLSDALAQVRSLKLQLDVLEARLRAMEPPEQKKIKTFADLHGILKGISPTTDEEIDAVRYRGISEDSL